MPEGWGWGHLQLQVDDDGSNPEWSALVGNPETDDVLSTLAATPVEALHDLAEALTTLKGNERKKTSTLSRSTADWVRDYQESVQTDAQVVSAATRIAADGILREHKPVTTFDDLGLPEGAWCTAEHKGHAPRWPCDAAKLALTVPGVHLPDPSPAR